MKQWHISQTWWPTAVISGLGRLRQAEDCKSKAQLHNEGFGPASATGELHLAQTTRQQKELAGMATQGKGAYR